MNTLFDDLTHKYILTVYVWLSLISATGINQGTHGRHGAGFVDYDGMVASRECKL